LCIVAASFVSSKDRESEADLVSPTGAGMFGKGRLPRQVVSYKDYALHAVPFKRHFQSFFIFIAIRAMLTFAAEKLSLPGLQRKSGTLKLYATASL